ncbi:MAG: TetR/AcrR family transcriptional regulator [Deltaproteobacteria bacterium]|nr:TetR/AcrR family transcriptional regulator [Deltaproteobacteria bacterium]
MEATPRQRQAEALRRRISEEALALFAAQGFAGTSIQAVADAVGISKQALMHHFPSKQRLREAAFDRMQAHVAELVPQLLMALTGGDDRVDIVLDQVMGILAAERHWARFILRDLLDGAREAPDFGPSATAWVSLAADYIRRGQADGIIRPDVDPEAAIPSVGLLVVSTFATLDQRPSPQLLEASTRDDWQQRRLKELVRMVRAGLLADV